MNRQEQIAEIAEQSGMSEAEIEELVDLLGIDLEHPMTDAEDAAHQAALMAAATETRRKRYAAMGLDVDDGY